MTNFTLFLNSFLSYLLVFFVFGAAIIVAYIIGINIRKAKNNKIEADTKIEEDNE